MLKKIAIGFASFVLTACCCTPPLDPAEKPLPEAGKDTFEDALSENYENNFIACRNDIIETRLDSIVNAAVSSGKPVVIYFHGGLSSQGYVHKTLGPTLMKNVFDENHYGPHIYPIFFNYDVNPVTNWKKLFKRTFKRQAFEELEGRFEEALKTVDTTKGVKVLSNQDRQVRAAQLIDLFKGSASIKSNSVESFKYEPDEYIEILEAEQLPPEFEPDGLKVKKLRGVSLEELARDIDAYVEEVEEDVQKYTKENRLELDKLVKKNPGLRVLRILARLALNSDHGFTATIQEEILDYLGVSKLGAKHWTLVKDHSRECFAKKSYGRAIIDRLFDAGVTVNVLSHSAGSIPASVLVRYVAEEKQNAKLNNIAMLAPAINQKVFRDMVIPNQSAFNNLRLYVLDEENELNDDVVHDILYSSSLLYAVSSLGEEQNKTLDEMLMIDQHLDPNRRPYTMKSYLKLACEEPKDVWDYIGENNSVVLYPSQVTVNPDEQKATHESSKLPLESPCLVEHYIDYLLGKKVLDYDKCPRS